MQQMAAKSKFYTFSLASSALNSVVRPLPVVFDEPRCQKTAKDRRKSSSDRQLEIRRHEFHCVESAPTSEITKGKVSVFTKVSLFPHYNAKQVSCLTKKCSSAASCNPHC